MMKALASFEWLLEASEHSIKCPTMLLESWHDGGSPIFEGSGRLTLNSSESTLFEMDASACEESQSELALLRCGKEVDDNTTAMRLIATDEHGRKWNAGWVRPELGDVLGKRYQFFGECASLLTSTRHDEEVSGVELAFSSAPKVPFTELMTNTASLGGARLGWSRLGGRHRMDVLGAEITAWARPQRNELCITARTSERLNHPYLENWLSEPLRALRGQLIYPRLVARNFADGTSTVWVRPAPVLRETFGGCVAELSSQTGAEFWRFYADYLTYVAMHRSADGHPGFEANQLTRLHHEVIQARQSGSHWVIALSVASAIEGLAKLDPVFASSPAEFAQEDLGPLRTLVLSMPEGPLRSRLSGWLQTLNKPSAARYLARLENSGRITRAQMAAWRKVRNQVAHGNLFEPWGTPEEHEQLVLLVKLFYRLTALRVGYSK